jgi:hypothetical protein
MFFFCLFLPTYSDPFYVIPFFLHVVPATTQNISRGQHFSSTYTTRHHIIYTCRRLHATQVHPTRT